jgi:hypothetical protein
LVCTSGEMGAGCDFFSLRSRHRKPAMADITVHLDDELYDKASRVARLDNVSVKELVEDVRRRHLDYVEVVEDFSKMPPFSLENYELHRDADESDED